MGGLILFEACASGCLKQLENKILLIRTGFSASTGKRKKEGKTKKAVMNPRMVGRTEQQKQGHCEPFCGSQSKATHHLRAQITDRKLCSVLEKGSE